tara:strand:+ start:69 stop:245 length:177 start_codon:yes stop_codon:yes gene_type:complete
MKSKLDKLILSVANYIAYESDEVHDEVCWLLEQKYSKLDSKIAVDTIVADYQMIEEIS